MRKFCTLIMLIVILTLAAMPILLIPVGATTTGAYGSTEGMVSYWRFDEGTGTKAYDSVGANNGTLVNGPVWTSGKVGKALSFDGVNDYVDAGRVADSLFQDGNSFTFEAWVKVEAPIVAGKKMPIVDRARTGLQILEDGEIDMFIAIGWGGEGEDNWAHAIGPKLSNGEWYHVVGVYEDLGSTQYLRVYLNGELENSSLSRPIWGYYLSTLYIGWSSHLSGSMHFHGSIDEVAVYNRTLSASEIQQHYQNSARTFGLNLRTVDWDGSALPSCNVTIASVGSKTSSANGWANFTGVSPGTYTVITRWQGSKVNQTSLTLSTSNVTMNLKCHVWILAINAKDKSGNFLSPSTTRIYTTLPNGTHVNSSGVNTATYRVMNGTFYFRVKWQGSWVSRNISAYLEPIATQNLLCDVYSISFTNSFKDATGNALVTPPSSFRLICPNGTTTQPLYVWSSYYLQNGTFRWSNIMWNNTDVTPSPSSTFDPTNGNPTVNTKVLQTQNIDISRDLLLRTIDWSGNVLPSCSVTVSASTKTSNSNGWANFTGLPPGPYSIIVEWQGSKVNQTSVTLTTSNMTVNIKCQVYSLTFNFKDSSGKYVVTPSQFIVEAPNGTIRTLTTYNIPRVQNGTWIIRQIKWQGNNVVPTPNPTRALTSSGVWTVETRVYHIDFSNSFLDKEKNRIPDVDSFRLLCPNGTTTQPLQPRNYLLQNGTYAWRNIILESRDVTPSETQTFDPVDGNPTINLGLPPKSFLELIIRFLLQPIDIGPLKIPLIVLILLFILIIIMVVIARRRR